MLRSLFGIGPKVDYKELVANGATILDVRSKAEYASGHVVVQWICLKLKGSKHTMVAVGLA